MNNSTKYETKDLILAATLKVLGYKLDSIHVEFHKGKFVFDDVPEHAVISYDMGDTKVEPQQFSSTVKQLTIAARRLSDARRLADTNN